MANHYAILGIRPDATAEELRRAYRRLALRHHPDRNPGDATAAERFLAIQEAYEALRRRPRPRPAPAWTPAPPRTAPSPAQPQRGVTQRAAASFAAALAALALAVTAIARTIPAASPLSSQTPTSGAQPFLAAALVALALAAGSWFAADSERQVLAHARAMRAHRLRGYAPNLPLPSPVSETIVALTLQLARLAFVAALLAFVTASNA